jgi:hypothetical protein
MLIVSSKSRLKVLNTLWFWFVVSGDVVEKIGDREPGFKLGKKTNQHRLKVMARSNKDLMGNETNGKENL